MALAGYLVNSILQFMVLVLASHQKINQETVIVLLLYALYIIW